MTVLELNDNKVTYKNLYSFDVFDTLITRTTVKPVGIFAIMQKKMQSNNKIPQILKDNFYTIRKETEGFTRSNLAINANKKDISIYDIYDVIQFNYALSDEIKEYLIELELDTELKNIRPLKNNINILKSLISNGNKVILISDMYLTSTMIRNLLTSIDEIFKDIDIYVSNEMNLSKADGDIYSYIKNKFDVKSWVHYGDNIYADINQAKKFSIEPVYLKQQQLEPIENFALKNNEDNFFIQSLMGISKLTKTNRINYSKAYNFGATVAGPYLYNYVNWIINQAGIRNIKTLYFIARDGFVLKQIADIIIKNKRLDLKTKYIYGSRIAWRIPDENNIEKYLKDKFDEYNDRCSLKFLSQILDVDIEKLKEYTSISNVSKIIKGKKIRKLRDKFINSDEIKNELIKEHKNKKELLVEYLKQELNLNEDNIAFVDISGSGRTQDIISNIIKEFYQGKIFTFYFHTELNCNQKNSQKFAFIKTNSYYHYAIELLCRNLDGQTLGYKKENNKIIPILEEIDNSKIKNWGFDDYLEAIIEYANNASNFEIINNLSLISYDLYKKYFDYLIFNLDKDLADIMGSIPFDEVGSEKSAKQCAPKYGFFDCIRYVFKGKKEHNMMFIKLKRSGKLLKILYLITENYGSIRKFLFNIYYSKTKKMLNICILGIKITFKKEVKVAKS